MVRINHALGVVRTEAREALDEARILELCREFGYEPEADGKLDPATLVALFLQQIAAGNVSCDHVRLMGGDAFSASGYCQARARLPLAVIHTLAREVYQKLNTPTHLQQDYRWLRHPDALLYPT